MPEIIPAILPKSFAELEEKVGLVRGLVDTVQIDFCDGKFVHYKTWPFTEKGQKRSDLSLDPRSDLGKRGWGDVDFEAHLMVAEPAPLIPDLVKAGFSRILVHVESFQADEKGPTLGAGERSDLLADLIHEWRGAVEIGAALLIETPLAAVDSFAHELTSIQLMGIAHIGKQGEPFDERVVARVRAARARYPRLALAVDGGVSLLNARALLDAGASRLVVGSAIFASGNPRAVIEKFKRLG